MLAFKLSGSKSSLPTQVPTSNDQGNSSPASPFSASASGAQSVLADNPLVPVSVERMSMADEAEFGIRQCRRFAFDLTLTLSTTSRSVEMVMGMSYVEGRLSWKVCDV